MCLVLLVFTNESYSELSSSSQLIDSPFAADRGLLLNWNQVEFHKRGESRKIFMFRFLLSVVSLGAGATKPEAGKLDSQNSQGT